MGWIGWWLRWNASGRPTLAETRRACAGPCGKNRSLRFFPADKRRTDGLSEKCVTCHRRRRYTGTRDARLQETYGITQAEFDAILAAQGGCCAICGGTRSGYDLDHDHAMVKNGSDVRSSVRGVLCRRCNRRLLPASTDNRDVLWNAINYLTHPPAWSVLNDTPK